MTIALASWILLAVVSAGDAGTARANLVITSDSSCPTGDAVREAMNGLRSPEDWPRTAVAISAKDAFLTITLGADPSNPRTIAVASDCGARAAMAALVIATWSSDLPAEVVHPPVLQPLIDANAKLASATALVVPANPPGRLELGAGLLASLGGGIVPAMRLEFGGWGRESPLGWQISLVLPWPREIALAGGTTGWTRVAANLALRGRVLTKGLQLSADAGIAAGHTMVWGRDYDRNRTEHSLTYGLVAGVRGGIPWRRMMVWADVRGTRWLYEQSVQIDSDADAVSDKVVLPSWDAQFTLGASYVF
jgi:hypothetical protein